MGTQACLLPALLVAAALCPPAQAAIRLYDDAQAYFAAAGVPRQAFDFGGGPAQPVWIDGGRFRPDMAIVLCGTPGPPCSGSSGVPWAGRGLRYEAVATGFSRLVIAIEPQSPDGSLLRFDRQIAFVLSGDTTGLQLGLENALTGEHAGVSLSGGTGFIGVDWDALGFTSASLGKSAFQPGYDAAFTLERLYLAAAVPEPGRWLLLALGWPVLWRALRRRHEKAPAGGA